MPSPSVLGVPHVHIVHSLVPGATPLLVLGVDGVITSQELVSPDPPRRKEVILIFDSCLRARGNSLEHPPLNVGPSLGHRDGDGKLLPSGLDKITNQTSNLHVTQLLTGTRPPFLHFQG